LAFRAVLYGNENMNFGKLFRQNITFEKLTEIFWILEKLTLKTGFERIKTGENSHLIRRSKKIP